MSTNTSIEKSGSFFGTAMVAAAKLPGVRIDREGYLRSALSKHVPPVQLERAVAETPAAAGVPLDLLNRIADQSIGYETAKVSALAAAAGIPGGIAMLGTVPADMAQNLAHMLRISQKLAYLYSWPELFGTDSEEPDDATQGVLTLFLGVMFGASAAIEGVSKLADIVAKQVVRQLPRKALTKGLVFPVVRRVAGMLGVRLTKDAFAKGIAKFVPIAGAALSGGLTLATFLPMAKRLKRHLAGLELSKPVVATPSEVVGADDVAFDEEGTVDSVREPASV